MRQNDISIHLSFSNVDEKDIYTNLDLVIQFLLKNNLNGSIVLNRHDVLLDDDED